MCPVRGGASDQTALALADRGGDVDDPTDQVGLVGRQAQALVRVHRHGVGEVGAVLGALGVGAVDAVDADHRVELLPALALAGLADLADDGVAAAQVVLADHRRARGRRPRDRAGSPRCARRRSCRACRGCPRRGRARRPRGSWCRARCDHPGAPAYVPGRGHAGAGCGGCRPRRRHRRRRSGSGFWFWFWSWFWSGLVLVWSWFCWRSCLSCCWSCCRWPCWRLPRLLGLPLPLLLGLPALLLLLRVVRFRRSCGSAGFSAGLAAGLSPRVRLLTGWTAGLIGRLGSVFSAGLGGCSAG